jgi:hypothetical protein
VVPIGEVTHIGRQVDDVVESTQVARFEQRVHEHESALHQQVGISGGPAECQHLARRGQTTGQRGGSEVAHLLSEERVAERAGVTAPSRHRHRLVGERPALGHLGAAVETS